jgi:hypothetical protein
MEAQIGTQDVFERNADRCLFYKGLRLFWSANGKYTGLAERTQHGSNVEGSEDMFPDCPLPAGRALLLPCLPVRF